MFLATQLQKLAMRHLQKPQLRLGQIPIQDIEINLDSRDDIPKILLALKHLHQDTERRDVLLKQIAQDFAADADLNNGAPGMDFWQVFVLGALRLGLGCDYDRLADLANEHQTLRKMLGHGAFDEVDTYGARTLGENLSRLRPQTLQFINWLIVGSAHQALGVDTEDALRGRCDSTVVKTDAHYPTDANLLVDAIRKVLYLGGRLAAELPEVSGWREHHAHFLKFRRRYHRAIKLKRSTSQDAKKKAAKDAATREAFLVLLETAGGHIRRALEAMPAFHRHAPAVALEIERFIHHAIRQSEQIRARVIRNEVVPHSEKVFSLFEEHTEWVVKGKAGVPVELGLRCAFLEDQYGLILNHRVMQGETDEKITVWFTRETRVLFPNLRAVSFDKGFYTPDNRDQLDRILDQVTLPKKGGLSGADRERESAEAFVAARQQHPAIESAIHALKAHGLERCRDQGIAGFRRYVAWGVVGFNLHRLGAILMEQARAERDRRALRKAA